MGTGRGQGKTAWADTREWPEQKVCGHRLLPKEPAGSYIEIEEVDLLQVSLCLQNVHHLATQEGSLRREASASLLEGLLTRNFWIKLRPVQ